MAFTWKAPKDIWKGEGIYHLTFTVAGRRPLLGELVPLAGSNVYSGGERTIRSYSGNVARPNDTDVLPYNGWRKELCKTELATVRLSAFGLSVHRDLMAMPERYSYASTDDEPAIVICGKQFMPDHLHVVVWVKKDLGKSIRQVAQGFRIGMRKLAVDSGVWDDDDGHPFEVPFIRTLSHKGQLGAMVKYVHANPDNAWMRRLHPDLYVIRRRQEHGGLLFDTMGKARLLDYPDKQVVALSRSLTQEQIVAEINKALWNAERGAVTYCAAINDGEKAVAKAIREGGYPLVVMMLEGFPAEGTEAARYFHPNGVYHKACGEGKLYLLAPYKENYESPWVIEQTESELKRKAEEKHQHYEPLPHSSKRWRMIAANVMMKRIGK